MIAAFYLFMRYKIQEYLQTLKVTMFNSVFSFSCIQIHLGETIDMREGHRTSYDQFYFQR